MERKRKIIAALADLRQDIAGPVPVDLISKWQQYPLKTPETELEVLKPYERSGYLVSTDSSGLSRLTAERSLVEVMKIVSEPKEIIFEMGKKIGGRGVGIWAADNSQMFYEEKVGVRQLVEQMAAAQKVIHQGLLQVGMGIHKGIFWEIGGGMFGPEAEMLEAVAEEFTSGKEIVLSEKVKEELGMDFEQKLIWREDLTHFARKFFTLNYDELGGFFREFKLPEAASLSAENFYPFPFSSEFFLRLKSSGNMEDFFANKVVVLVKIYHQKNRLLLDELTDWVLVNAMLNEIAANYDLQLVKSNGELGIFVADKDSEAVEFAEDLLLSMMRENDVLSIGLARGDILMFDLDGGGKDLAGGPVNIASKISEDIVDQNSLYVHESVLVPPHHFSRYESFALEKSNVVLKGLRYKNN